MDSKAFRLSCLCWSSAKRDVREALDFKRQQGGTGEPWDGEGDASWDADWGQVDLHMDMILQRPLIIESSWVSKYHLKNQYFEDMAQNY